MAESVPYAKYSIDSQEGAVELRRLHREEQILRRLGVLYLEDKVTRPRQAEDESDAAILKEAGVYYFNTKEFEAVTLEEEQRNIERQVYEKLMPKPLEPGVAEILRSAGVNLPDGEAVSSQRDAADANGSEARSRKLLKYDSLPPCTTASTAAGTAGESTVASTYAERELLRRLKHGWSSVGEECEECGMPVIRKSKGDLLECVICGVIGDGERYDVAEEDVRDDPDAGRFGAYEEVREGPGVFSVGGCSISALTHAHSLEPNERFDMDPIHETGHRRESESDLEEEAPLGGDQAIYSNARLDIFHDQIGDPVGSRRADDETFQEEIGLRLFEGWQLTEVNCPDPDCRLPLMLKDNNATPVCLRCG